MTSGALLDFPVATIVIFTIEMLPRENGNANPAWKGQRRAINENLLLSRRDFEEEHFTMSMSKHTRTMRFHSAGELPMCDYNGLSY